MNNYSNVNELNVQLPQGKLRPESKLILLGVHGYILSMHIKQKKTK